MKKTFNTLLKLVGFPAFLCVFLTTSAFAYSDAECFGESDGTPSVTGTLTLVNSLDDVVEGVSIPSADVIFQNNTSNYNTTPVPNPDGVVKCTSASACNLTEMKSSPSSREALNAQLRVYLAGQSWSVTFPGKGTVRGYAYCGPNGWGSGGDRQVKNGALNSAYAGCGCTITDFFDENVSISSFRFVTHKQTFAGYEGSDWLAKNNNCRMNCPSICANRVATQSAFRQTLFQECPVFETSGGGNEQPEPVQCSAGSYLKAGDTSCTTCSGNTYCEGGTFTPSETEDQGIATCPTGYEANSGHTACTPVAVICEAGWYLPANATECDKCSGQYYCEEDIYEFSTTQNQGLKTCSYGSVPNSTHTACELLSIHCNDGYYLPAGATSCSACIGFEYCPENTYNFSNSNDQGKYICASGSIPNANHSACVETTITCPAGKYLPDHSANEYDCQWCPDPYEAGDYYYCPGGEYSANATENAGMLVCPEYAYSEEEAEYCTCNDGYTTDGKPANASNKTTTTTACIQEGSLTYSATYVCDQGGESVGSVNVSYGSTFTLTDNSNWNNEPLCTKYGFEFAGWKDNLNNEYSAGDTFTWNYDGDLTFTAIWNQIPVYTVSYSCGDDATGGYAPSSEEVMAGAEYTTLANTCEKVGHTFFGWSYNDEDLYEAGETFVYNYNKSITLVPLWETLFIPCAAGYYLPTNANACIEVGAGYYSPNGDAQRYACPTGLTTSGSGIGADESSDCGRVLHIGGETLRMRSIRKTTPSLNVKIGGSTYYGDMTTLPTKMNSSSQRELHVKYGDVEQYIHDTTIE